MKTTLCHPIAILTFAAITFIFAPNAFGQSENGCEQILINDLQSCFISKGVNLEVSVVNGYAFISGNLGNPVDVSNANDCINDYFAASGSCPTAYELFANATQYSDASSTTPVITTNSNGRSHTINGMQSLKSQTVFIKR